MKVYRVDLQSTDKHLTWILLVFSKSNTFEKMNKNNKDDVILLPV